MSKTKDLLLESDEDFDFEIAYHALLEGLCDKIVSVNGESEVVRRTNDEGLVVVEVYIAKGLVFDEFNPNTVRWKVFVNLDNPNVVGMTCADTDKPTTIH